MATIIDALVVTLGLDSSGFNKGRKEVGEGLDETRDNADRTAKDMEAAGKRAASFFGSIKTELLALVGVSLSVNGIKNFVKDMTGGLQTLAVNSKALDMSARSLDGWQRAAEMAGSSAEEITGKLQAFQNLITDFKGGGNVSDNPINKALQGFAGAVGGDIDLQNMSSGDIMKFVAENFHKLSKDAQRKFANDMGYSNALLMTLSEGTLLPNQRSAEANSGITDESLRKAQDMQKSIVDMEQSFKSAAITLYSTLVPYIDKYLIPALNKISDWITDHGPEIEKFFSDSADEISKAVDAVGGWENVLQGLLVFVAGKWLLGMTSALGGVRNALLGISRLSLIGGLVLLQQQAEKLENKYGWLKNNTWAATLNNLPGTTALDKAGKATSSWMRENLGIGFRDDDGYVAPPQASKEGKTLLDSLKDTFSNLEKKFQLPEGLLRSVATTESGGDPNAVGPQTKYGQAKGMFQFIDSTASDMGLKGNEVFNPVKSAEAAAKYLSQLLKSTGGNLVEAIAAYNWGIGNLKSKGIENAPGETRDYVPKVMAGVDIGATATAMRQQAMQQQQPQGNKTEINIGEMSVSSSAGSINQLGQDVQSKVNRSALVSAYSTGQR